MHLIRASLFVVTLIVVLSPDTASARLFRRGGSNSYSGYSTTTASSSVSREQVATAQGVAVLMAKYGRVGHWGGNSGYEGCGCGMTPQAAYNSCCYANSGMATVDVGYARGSNGMWYCCRRYR